MNTAIAITDIAIRIPIISMRIENIENTFYEYFYNFTFDEDKDSRELRPGRSLYRVYVKNTNGEIKDIDEDEIRTFMQG